MNCFDLHLICTIGRKPEKAQYSGINGIFL